MILPIAIIAFQIIALLMSIAIEAYWLRKRLNWPRQQSVQYASAANLIACVMLWLFVFIFEGQLPQWLRFKLIRFILFSSPFESIDEWSIEPIFILGLIVTYVVVCFTKVKVLDILKVSSQPLTDLTEVEAIEATPSFVLRARLAFSQEDEAKNRTVFLANLFSFGAVLGLMFLQLLFND
ncbi:MAG: hypothetical protein SAJ12_08610 [Jaaginema sp. PMC 1079.18]|nr:hypothetical protein [Jaaginema sp. PMC 1080.18]MEC4851060.1 hypothetical protein [Jaaginema sp. PMC 1079.18]MEC4866976.1 hypothetical protein [Jaaginema sp. PMC 1078.18]